MRMYFLPPSWVLCTHHDVRLCSKVDLVPGEGLQTDQFNGTFVRAEPDNGVVGGRLLKLHEFDFVAFLGTIPFVSVQNVPRHWDWRRRCLSAL